MTSMYLQLTINCLILISHQKVKRIIRNKGHQPVKDLLREEMALEGIKLDNTLKFKQQILMNFDSFRSKRLVPSTGDWRVRCREILQLIWNHHDSEPFREPVDIVDHPGKFFLNELSVH